MAQTETPTYDENDPRVNLSIATTQALEMLDTLTTLATQAERRVWATSTNWGDVGSMNRVLDLLNQASDTLSQIAGFPR